MDKADLIDAIEAYEFRDKHDHTLELCKEWNALKDAVGYFEEADKAEIKGDLGHNQN